MSTLKAAAIWYERAPACRADPQVHTTTDVRLIPISRRVGSTLACSSSGQFVAGATCQPGRFAVASRNERPPRSGAGDRSWPGGRGQEPINDVHRRRVCLDAIEPVTADEVVMHGRTGCCWEWRGEAFRGFGRGGATSWSSPVG
jgi:hypothetical protein